jgi:hypothetical protein
VAAGGSYRPSKAPGGSVAPAAPVRLMGRRIALLKPANDNAAPYGMRVRIITAAVAALAGLGGLALLYFT